MSLRKMCQLILTISGEAKEIFEDCDEYETRFLVDLLKCAKTAMRKDKEVRNQFNR